MINEQDVLQVHLDAAVIRIQELEAALSAKDQQVAHLQHDLDIAEETVIHEATRAKTAETALGEARQQIAHLQAEVYEPNIWICQTCGFTVTKAFLRASDGAVGIDRAEVQDVCPNDGTSMRRQTFKESADAAGKFAVDVMNRLNDANQLLEKNEPAYVKLLLKYEQAIARHKVEVAEARQQLAALRQLAELANGALADIAFSNDMNLGTATKKATRIYNEVSAALAASRAPQPQVKENEDDHSRVDSQ